MSEKLITNIPVKSTILEIKFSDHSGLGYGEGQISLRNRRESGELTDDIYYRGIMQITDPINFQPALGDDPACIDGRSAFDAYYYQDHRKVLVDNLPLRPKVIGGGLVTMLAGQIGIGQLAPSLNDQIKLATDFLHSHNMHYGAHTDHQDHSKNDPNCGCGAIDNLPKIIQNSVKYSPQIKESLMIILGDLDNMVFDTVVDNFHQLANHLDAPHYSGSNVMNSIVEDGVVISELEGAHKECAIILNMVVGTTFSKINLTKATDGQMQAFDLDVWVLEKFADKLASGESSQKLQAYYAMLILALATAATLTDGSQLVFVHK